MKKIFASIGVVALGAASVQANSAAGLASGGDNAKFYSVQATLRGFYDDNYATSSDASGDKHGSFGFSVIPSIAFKFPMDQTTLGFRYTYSANWYEDRSRLSSTNNAWDQSHEFEAMLSHSFNERFSVDVMDSFVVSQEPGLIDASGVTTFPYRTDSDNIRNHGEINFNGTLTRQLSFVLGYQNTYYDYSNKGDGVDVNDALEPSLSGLLDRMEHEALVNLRWQALPRTVLIGGYNYRQVDYSSDEAVALTTSGFRYADSRNNHSHIIYGGIDQNFSKELLLTVRLGAQMLDTVNALPSDPNKETTSPWGSLNLTYMYRPGSSLQLGFRHSRNQTDVISPVFVNDSITVDQQTSVLYGNITHRLSPKLTGRLTGMWQNSEFFGGAVDGQSEQFFDLGVNFSYRFNNHFSGEAGYNFSHLTSDITGRDYDRNRVYLGVTAVY